MKSKLTSRKFWLAVAAGLASIGAGIAGLATANEAVATAGIVCTVASAAIYAGCEAYVDGKAAPQTVVTTNTTANTETKVSATASGAAAQPIIDAATQAKAAE